MQCKLPVITIKTKQKKRLAAIMLHNPTFRKKMSLVHQESDWANNETHQSTDVNYDSAHTQPHCIPPPGKA